MVIPQALIDMREEINIVCTHSGQQRLLKYMVKSSFFNKQQGFMAATLAKDTIAPLYHHVANKLDLIQALSIYIEPN